jgi:hypothetical protein
MAVSEEFGIEAFLIYDRPINSDMFCEIFDLLDRRGTRWKLLGDSASWHRSNFTTNQLNLRGGKTMSHSLISVPILNPIENCFNVCKNNFKRQKLNRIQNNQRLITKEMVKNCVYDLKKDVVKNLCRAGWKRWSQDSFKLAVPEFFKWILIIWKLKLRNRIGIPLNIITLKLLKPNQKPWTLILWISHRWTGWWEKSCTVLRIMTTFLAISVRNNFKWLPIYYYFSWQGGSTKSIGFEIILYWRFRRK